MPIFFLWWLLPLCIFIPDIKFFPKTFCCYNCFGGTLWSAYMYQYINVEAVSCTSALTCDALENKSSALWGITNTKPKPKPTKQKNSSSGLIFDLLNKNFCIVLPRRFLFLLTWSSWKSRFKNHWVRECKSIRKTKAVKNWESVHLRNGGAGGRGRSSFSMEYF